LARSCALATRTSPGSRECAGLIRSEPELAPDPALVGVHLGVGGRPGLGQGAGGLAGGVADRGADAGGLEGTAEAVGQDLGGGVVALGGQKPALLPAQAG